MLSLKSIFNSGLQSTHNVLLKNERTHNKPPPKSRPLVLPYLSPGPTSTPIMKSTSTPCAKFESSVNHIRNRKPQPVSCTTTSMKSTAPTHAEQEDNLKQCPMRAWEGHGIIIRRAGLCFSGGRVEKRKGREINNWGEKKHIYRSRWFLLKDRGHLGCENGNIAWMWLKEQTPVLWDAW